MTRSAYERVSAAVALAARVLALAAVRVVLAADVRVRRAVVVLRCVLAAGFEPAVRVELVVDALRVRVVVRLRVAGFLVVVLVLLVAMLEISPSRLRILVLSRRRVYPSNMCL